MNSPVKRSWKLQDFMAHGASVNCLSLGKKSGQVLATGGDDKKVNLWALGKSNCIMSLSGHSTPVESVQFGNGEETLSAGCQSGAIKIWNLAVPTVQRTLNGHKSSITSVDFHPYGDYLCSGSLDSFIKLWDLRRKGCIYTYRGHSKSINSIRFSPDGQWIASGGEDGVVRIWDLRAGKRISDLTQHSAPVTDVVFHPHEFLLASSSADRTINFWDLEKFSLVSTTEKSSSTIRCLTFSEGGECLLAGDSEGLKVYGWEPARQYDAQPMGWGKVQDLAVTGTQLIGASFHLTNTSIHILDLSLVHPLGTPPPQYTSSVPFSHNTSLRKSFTKGRPGGTKPKLDVKPSIEENTESEEPGIEEELFATIANPRDYTAIFQPNRALNRSPVHSNPSIASDSEEWVLVTPKPPLSHTGGDSSTPPLSPVRPQRKLSAHRPPSLSLSMMNPADMSSPEYELAPKLNNPASELSNISKLYISSPSPASRGSSRTASPKRSIPPASPSYSTGSLDGGASTSYPYPPYRNKPLERDVDDLPPYIPPDKPSVDFEVPTKESDEARIYPTYNAPPLKFNQSYATPTKENDYSGSMNSYDADEPVQYHSSEPPYATNVPPEHARFVTKDSDRYYTKESPSGNHSNGNATAYQGNQIGGFNAGRCRDYFRSSSTFNSPMGGSEPMPASMYSNSKHNQESSMYSNSKHSHDSNMFNSSKHSQDLDAPPSMFTKQGQESMFSKHSQDSGFSTLDSFSTGSPVGTMGRGERDQIIPMNLSTPVGLDMEQFLPKSYSSHQARGGRVSMTESELMSTIFNGHEKMMAVLRNRQRSLGLVYMAVNNKNMEAGIETALGMNDGTVMVDLLKSMIPRRNVWNLELCSTILPVCQDLLQSKYEMYITTACDTLNLILRTFGPVIKNNMKWSGGSSIGVDISKEERYKKCVKVYNALQPVKSVLLKKQTVQGKLGQTFRDLLSEIETIDS
uniref:Katanin p80 WD40 repeat-containing subunit B1 n=2 Tax=Cacopsylla melanoneura TaxID=428564 RepID=A0A8D8Y6B5_9HEMI